MLRRRFMVLLLPILTLSGISGTYASADFMSQSPEFSGELNSSSEIPFNNSENKSESEETTELEEDCEEFSTLFLNTIFRQDSALSTFLSDDLTYRAPFLEKTSRPPRV